ncbi:cell division protein ZapA [Porphyrobacter sp. YT40]|uniref:cell division protein ZapA n=1 Tax=Porphyrobacter sp. YT40 TaxID=2547601 RepID=UPI001142C4E6|nr:cell division protein ZapA [Porphyrobacter sp. YT40]QDH35137.1 cell division protein ZapA [Porphyrobacter sp. YT40]
MSTVSLSIGPKTYTVACADGQEAHITALGAMIAEKYGQLGSARAPLEAQNLLFTALFLADELAEARKAVSAAAAPDTGEVEALQGRIAALEAELSEVRAGKSASARAPAPGASQSDLFGSADDGASAAIADQLEALAARIEASAAALEGVAASA